MNTTCVAASIQRTDVTAVQTILPESNHNEGICRHEASLNLKVRIAAVIGTLIIFQPTFDEFEQPVNNHSPQNWEQQTSNDEYNLVNVHGRSTLFELHCL